MILSTAHRFIFTAIPKTGTHAVRRALREHLGPDDMEQVGLYVQKQFPIPAVAALKHGHVALRQIREHIPAEQFEGFFKFAFVRNPYDRFISYCAFMTRDKPGLFERDPKAVMRRMLADPPRQHILFWPQYLFVCDDDGRILADELGRVETMQQSYDSICARIGIPSAALEKVNSSAHGDYRRYYDDEIAAAVGMIYERDLAMFGYEY